MFVSANHSLHHLSAFELGTGSIYFTLCTFLFETVVTGQRRRWERSRCRGAIWQAFKIIEERERERDKERMPLPYFLSV